MVRGRIHCNVQPDNCWWFWEMWRRGQRLSWVFCLYQKKAQASPETPNQGWTSISFSMHCCWIHSAFAVVAAVALCGNQTWWNKQLWGENSVQLYPKPSTASCGAAPALGSTCTSSGHSWHRRVCSALFFTCQLGTPSRFAPECQECISFPLVSCWALSLSRMLCFACRQQLSLERLNPSFPPWCLLSVC